MDGQERGAPGAEMWGQLVIDSLVRPRGAARQVIDAAVPPAYLLQGAVLVACLAMVLNFFALKVIGTVDPLTTAMLSSPIIAVVEQVLLLFVVVVLTVRIGRLFGGKGEFWACLALLVWLNMVGLMVMAAQVVLLLLLPANQGLVSLVTLAPLLWLVWVYANFVAELHEFQNPFFVLGAMILTGMVLFFAIAMLLTMLGFGPQELS